MIDISPKEIPSAAHITVNSETFPVVEGLEGSFLLAIYLVLIMTD